MEPVEEDWQRATAIVAHPDDLEYGVASAIARWTSQGKEVSYVLVTSGEAGIAGMDPGTAGPLREQEERASAAVVGVSDVVFLRRRDGEVEYGLSLRRDLAGAIRNTRPDVVVGMNFELTWGEGPHVNHSDHRAVGLAVLDACRDAANEWVFSDVGAPWKGTKAVLVAGSSSPTHFVEVSGFLERGIASLREHRVYIEGLGTDFDPESFLRSSAQQAGREAGCELAVPFRAFGAA